MTVHDVGMLLKETFWQWFAKDFKRLGAALAYYIAFSIIPILIISAWIATILIRDQNITQEFIMPVEDVAGEVTAETIEGAIVSVRDNLSPQPTAAIVSGFFLLYCASRMFIYLKEALNDVWEVPDSTSGFRVQRAVKNNVLSMLLVMVFGLLLIMALVIHATLFALFQSMGRLTPDMPLLPVIQIVGIALLFLIVTLLFAAIYRFIPDARVAWRDVWVGAGMTALLFTVGQYLLGLYLDLANLGTLYGAATAIMLILIWVYYSAHLILFGAKFTHLYANRFGSKIVPLDRMTHAPITSTG